MVVDEEDGPERPRDPEVVVGAHEHDERLDHHDEERRRLYHRPLVLQERPPPDPARLQEQLRRHQGQRGDLDRAVHLVRERC